MMFLRIFGWRIRFNDTEVEAVEGSAALQENFLETEGSTQTATILLCMAGNWTDGSVNTFKIKYYSSRHIHHHQLINESIVPTIDSVMSISMIHRSGADDTRINRKSEINYQKL
jgi:hypothetical protein